VANPPKELPVISHKAFISYSHQSDAVLAPAIQSALHKFAKPWYRMRALRVFRDTTSLAANAALGPSIEKALSEAEWLLLLASPLSASSRWVRQEIAWWLENRSVEQMLILLTDGELAWDTAGRDFDWSRTTAIPKDMTGRFADEPLYVDLRWARAEPQSLTLQHAKFRSAILDIAAPLHGRPKDELDGEDVRQHRRTRIISVAAAAAILVGAAIAGWQAYVATQARLAAEQSEKDALEQRDEATRQRGFADEQRKIADEQRDEAVAQKKVAEEQRAEASRQRDEARRQRDAALGALLRSEAERLESVEQLDAALLLALESGRYSHTADIYDTVYRIVANRAKPVYYSPNPVEFSVVAPNGRYAAVVDPRRISLVDLAGSKELLAIAEPRVMRARFNADSTRLAVVTQNGAVKIFAVPEGTLQSNVIEPGDTETELRLPNLSEDGSLVATVVNRTVRILETFGGRLLFEQSHTEELTAAFPAGPDLAAVVTASGKRGVLSSHGFVAMRAERRSGLRHIAVSPGRDLLAFKFQDPGEDVVVWNSRSGEEYAATGSRVKSAAFHPRGNQLALGLEDGTVLIRALPTGREAARFKFIYSVTNLKFSPDGRRLVALSSDSQGFATVHRIDTAGWLRIGSARVVPANFLLGSNSEIVINATGTTVSAGRSVLQFQDGVRYGWRTPPAELEHVTLSRDWKRVAGVVGRRAVVVADTRSGETVAIFDGCENFGEPTLSADGKLLAVRCPATKDLRFYDVARTRLIGSVQDTNRTPLAFTPASDQVLSGAELIDLASRRPAGVISPGVYSAIAFAPAGRHVLLAGGGFGTPALYEAIRGSEDRPKRRQIETGIVDSIAYSNDGSLAAAGFRGESNVKVYRTSDWKRTLLSQKDESARLSITTKIVFSGDGSLLAAVAESQRDQSFRKFVTLRVFDVATGNERVRVPLSQSPLGVRFTTDNQTVQVLGGQPHLEQLDFPLNVEQWIRVGCTRVRANLTREQWSLYLPGVDYRKTCAVLNPAATGPLQSQ
jgi:WD40 repeat protein